MGRNTRRLFVAALVVLGAGAAGAQTTPMTTTDTSSPSALPAAAAPVVEQIVALATTVEPGATGVTAFTVPAGRQLVVTDIVITNPSTTPVCGAAISPNATTSAGNTTATTAGSTATTPATLTATIESGTGALCVPAQTSLSLSLTTGIEFAAGQGVVLSNHSAAAAPAATPGTTATGATTTAAATAGPLFYHLRGFLVAPGVSRGPPPLQRSATASPGRCERVGVWGPCRGPHLNSLKDCTLTGARAWPTLRA